nr:ORF1 [Torque teno felis virus]
MYRRRYKHRRYTRRRRYPWRRRYFRRRYHRRRWRPTVRSTNLREYIPGRHRYITVTGWEPLANIYNTDSAKTRAEPYKSVEPQGTTGQWHGTWGAHYFTPDNLMLRAQAYWNQWSADWSTFDYIKYIGGTIKIPQTASQMWMINFDEYMQVNLKEYQPKVTEDRWVHPGVLLNNPHTHIIFPPNIYAKKRMYTIKIKPPPGWKGFQRLPGAGAFICTHWCWTWADLTHAFYDPSWQHDNLHTCSQEPWWGKNASLQRWVDRTKYASCGSAIDEKSWGPFLPCKPSQYPECSLFFMYKLRFKVVGNALWRPLPRNIGSNDLVPEPPGPGETDQAKTRHSPKACKRPQDTADIWRGDLDSDGILTEEALQRITGDHNYPKRRRLEEQRRLRSIARKLKLVLAKHNLLKSK